MSKPGLDTLPRYNFFVKEDLATIEKKLKEEIGTLSAELVEINKNLAGEKDPTVRQELLGEKMRILQFAKLNSKANLGKLSPEQIIIRDTILKGKDHNSVTKSDLLVLEANNIDIRSMLLSNKSENESDATTSISGESFGVGKQLKVNFGKNKSLNKRMGAGDILPQEVYEISVIPNNNKENNEYNGGSPRGPRTGKLTIHPKIGYYDKDGYIPVYNGDTIMIHKVLAPDANDRKVFDDKKKNELMGERQHDAEVLGAPITNLPIDQEAWESIDTPKNQSQFVSQYADLLNQECAKYDMPPGVVVQLIKMESSFDPKNSPKEYGNADTKGAYGLGQHILSTWNSVNTKHFNGQLIRTNPQDQIKATCAYLNEVKMEKKCDWAQAVIYYHAGPNVDSANISAYKNSNPGIAKLMLPGDTTAEGYKTAAAKFYKVDTFADAKFEKITTENTKEIFANASIDEFLKNGRAMMNIPYVLGGMSKSGIDCSGFISQIMIDSGIARSGFRYTAAGLKSFTQEIGNGQIKKGDFMFTWGPHANSGRQTYNHIAIVTEVLGANQVKVLDASGVKSGVGKVSERTVSIQNKHSFGRPNFYQS